MSLILGIETGTEICSVSLSRNKELIALRESTGPQDHAGKLAVYIDEIVRENGYEPDDLDAVAVGKGPGSYTGLRIGVSTAKALCYALKIPLVAVGSLEALANVAVEDHSAGIISVDGWDDSILVPMIDARRMEVYVQMFDTAPKAVSEVTAEIVTECSFQDYYLSGKQLVIFGNGAAKCKDLLPYNQTILVDVVPSARGLVMPAYDAFTAQKFEDVAYFEPFYLKDFVVTTSKKKIF